MKKALLISCFDWYKARLEPIRAFLIMQGYDVSVLLSDYDHIHKASIPQKYEECTYIHVPAYQSNLSFKRIRSHLSFGKQARQYISETKPDLLWMQLPPNNTAKYCTEYKKVHPDIKYFVDIVDLWPESMPLGKVNETPLVGIWKKWRNDSFHFADHVFTECDLYQEKLQGVLPQNKTSTLHLFKEQTDEERELVEKIISEKKELNSQVKLAYLGSMNSILDIDGICNVIKSFMEQGYSTELHAIGDGENRERFQGAVKETGCNAKFYGSIFDEKEKIKLLAPCDYALNMMVGNISVGLTIKSIDYFSYGLPLINNIKGDTWNIVNLEHLGINTKDGVLKAEDISTESDRDFVLRAFDTYFSRAVFLSSVKKAIFED